MKDKEKLKFLISNMLEEQWSSITSSRLFGKDRNNGDVVNKLNDFPDDNKINEYYKRIEALEPIMKQSQAYPKFIKELGNLNPNDPASLQMMYQNFLGYFSIKKDEFEITENDDYAASLAVADYFKYHEDRLR